MLGVVILCSWRGE